MEARVIKALLEQVDRLKAERASLQTPPKSKYLRVDEALEAKIRTWCSSKVVIFSGLPGQGKSFFVQQLAHIASSMGKKVYTLQWDKTSPLFAENGPDDYRTKEDGVVHTMVRRVTSAWARDQLLKWATEHGDEDSILIGEAPLVGGRFKDLVCAKNDAAEDFLTSDQCRFIIPVASADVQVKVQARRGVRMDAPVHPNEVHDCPD
jgi:hypothetical protein